MKAIYRIITPIILLMLVSCGEDLMELNKGETTLRVSANFTEVELDVLNPNAGALNFVWTTGTNKGTNAAISYRFEISLQDNAYEEGVAYELGKNVTNVAYTNESLNAILIDSLNVLPGSIAVVKARVIATVLAAGVDAQVSDDFLVSVKTFKPISKNLYIIGSATTNGWNADNATRMNPISGITGGFVWQGRLNAGEFKFITQLGKFLPSYNKGEGDNDLVYRELESDIDNKFMVAKAGQYRITSNIVTLTLKIEELDAPEFGSLWFVGGFSGWTFEEMRVDMLDPYVFYYNAELNSSNTTDEFKIATADNFDASTVFLRPEINDQGAGVGLNVVKWSENENSNDQKWKLAPGVYKIKLNLRTMKIDIVPFTPFAGIYLVGDATPNGWDIANATVMNTVAGNPYKFTWTGNLSAKELKFSCDRKSDWNGAFFLATTAGANPSGSDEQMLFSNPGSNPDNKWNITQAGTFTIELDQLQEIVKFTKQ